MNPTKWNYGLVHMVLVLFLLQLDLRYLLVVEATAINVHIVYLGEKKYDDPLATKKSHYKLLSDFLGSKEAAKKSILYSYRHGFSGFAARLTDAEAKDISKFPEVVKVIPNRMLQLQTTRSWDFMGVYHNAPTNTLTKNLGSGVIIGVIDSGIWPESESFNEEGMPPIPSHWKGVCQKGEEFNKTHCNRKIIGARWFAKGYLESLKLQNITNYPDLLSARDINGHGTHCASIAGGNFVKNANFSNLGGGLARGGAPRAHLAVYKTAWGTGGSSTAIDMLKGFDTAIGDGVDVISCSNSPETIPKPFYGEDDVIGIGAFHAIAKGIPVVAGAGNMGPMSQTVSNIAPWHITVAASTIDRAFQAPITLGNNRTFWGQSLNAGKKSHVLAELVYSGDISHSPNCIHGSLEPAATKGKIVLCFSSTKEADMPSAHKAVVEAGGFGIIYAQIHKDGIEPAICSISCVKVDYQTGSQILEYIERARSPTAKLSSANTILGKTTSPRVATFSSRGPSSLTPEVLKPDITAPGVDIIAAYVPLSDDLKPTFVPMFGTSMATPHVAGIVALIKSVYYNWSPAAIKSALVTTASQTATDGTYITAEGSSRKIADPFDFGGGHVNPSKVLDPGLIFDVTTSDYIQYLCYLGLTKSSIAKMAMKKVNCTQKRSFGLDLNLPSISVPNLKFGTTTTITRIVTNVGDSSSVYKAIIEAPPGIKTTVDPQVLRFNSAAKSLSFKVSFSSALKLHGDYKFGSLTWSDGKHLVRSPIVIRVIAFESFVDV